MTSQEDREWTDAYLAQVTSDPDIRNLAWNTAEMAHNGAEPPLTNADMAAARPYLRACFRRMSVVEVQSLSNADIAGLLARGCLGAYAYRLGRQERASARDRRRPSAK